MERPEIVALLAACKEEIGDVQIRLAKLNKQRQGLEMQLAQLNPSRLTVTEREVIKRAARFASHEDGEILRGMLEERT